MKHVFDVAIIGGGINGCGCAADAALRGLSVLLCEQDDLASKTSSKSTKLIHGGLRYLELLDFSLVKKALDERQKLLQLAPHLVRPLPFLLAHQKNMRPIWLLRLGLFLYDHLSLTNKLPRSKLIRRNQENIYFSPLAEQLNQGFLYYDCVTDDARLTLANAMQAKEHGATILPHTKLIQSEVIDNQWRLTFEPEDAPKFQIRAKAVINTSGPWVGAVSELLHIPLMHTMLLVKGSHIVIPKLYEGEHAYMLQNNDQRIVFAIPYHGYTMVGTTDVVFSGDLDNICIDPSEIDYLCAIVSQNFNNKLHKKDIIDTWSGARTLLSVAGKTPTALSRDYTYHYSKLPAPAITVYGGKITTYRQLAIHTIDQLQNIFKNLPKSRSHNTPLPGATTGKMTFSEFKTYANQKYHWLDEATKTRYLNNYGTRTKKILSGCTEMADLGICFSPTLYQIEVDYLLKEEWASNSEDILWRRTKLGLHIDDKGKKALEDYLVTIEQPPKENTPYCYVKGDFDETFPLIP